MGYELTTRILLEQEMWRFDRDIALLQYQVWFVSWKYIFRFLLTDRHLKRFFVTLGELY
jgi:hypothetical protein